MYPVLDNQRIQRLMRPGLLKKLCTETKEPLLRNQMKALVYVLMFTFNADKRGAISVDSITRSQNILEQIPPDWTPTKGQDLSFVIWILVGRAMFTYLFQLVGE